MASIIQDLITTLQKEEEVYRELIPIAKEKSMIIAKNDLQALQQITDREQFYVEKVMALDKKREETIHNIAVVLNKKEDTLDLKKIIALLAQQPKEQLELSEIHEKLKNTVHEFITFNNHNKSLIEQSLEMIEFNMNFIQSTQMAPDNNYTKSAGQASRLAADPGMFDAKQ